MQVLPHDASPQDRPKRSIRETARGRPFSSRPGSSGGWPYRGFRRKGKRCRTPPFGGGCQRRERSGRSLRAFGTGRSRSASLTASSTPSRTCSALAALLAARCSLLSSPSRSSRLSVRSRWRKAGSGAPARDRASVSHELACRISPGPRRARSGRARMRSMLWRLGAMGVGEALGLPPVTRFLVAGRR